MSDAALGIDVSRLAAWTVIHPQVSALLSACYASLTYQFFLVLAVVTTTISLPGFRKPFVAYK